MKRILSLLFALTMVFSLTACSQGTAMTLGTGSTTGTYFGYGTILSQYINKNAGVNTNVVSTGGSKANIQGIDAGNYQLGTVQSDVMAYAWEGTNSFEEEGKIDSFRTVAGLYAEPIQLVTVDDSINSVADLKGKSVSIGAPDSGVRFNAMDVLTAAGLTLDDIDEQYLNFDDSKDAMVDGKLAAAFIVAGPPTPAITELCTSNGARLVPIDGAVADKLLETCPFYAPFTIPAGTYAGQDADVTSITVKATLIVSASASEEDVYNITKSIFDNIDAISAEHAKGKELSIEYATSGISVPYHAGAAKYFAEQGVTVESK